MKILMSMFLSLCLFTGISYADDVSDAAAAYSSAVSSLNSAISSVQEAVSAIVEEIESWEDYSDADNAEEVEVAVGETNSILDGVATSLAAAATAMSDAASTVSSIDDSGYYDEECVWHYNDEQGILAAYATAMDSLASADDDVEDANTNLFTVQLVGPSYATQIATVQSQITATQDLITNLVNGDVYTNQCSAYNSKTSCFTTYSTVSTALSSYNGANKAELQSMFDDAESAMISANLAYTAANLKISEAEVAINDAFDIILAMNTGTWTDKQRLRQWNYAQTAYQFAYGRYADASTAFANVAQNYGSIESSFNDIASLMNQ